MLRRSRAYRMVRTFLLVVTTAARYLWLMGRAKLPWGKPSDQAWERAHARTGRAIYRLATRLGGVFVKLGQVFGARADYFPASFVGPLAKLHDQVPARPLAELRGHVEKELGRPLGEVFAEVSPEPIAAASLAQVHRARLLSGEEVVLKIQYPEVAKLFPVDLGSLRRGARVVRWLNRRLDLRPLVDELAAFIRLELDFEREARSTERVRLAFAQSPEVRVPKVHFGSARLLVLEYIDGIRVADVDALDAAGVDRKAVAERIASVYCSMIFEHGFFHGDPHPGNVFVCPDGKIGLLDFGLAKELPEGFAMGVATMIVSAMTGNGPAALQAARGIGFEFEGDDPSLLFELMRMMMGDYGGNAGVLDMLNRGPLKSLPSHITLIVRSMVLLNGLSHLLVAKERIIATTLMTKLGALMAAPAAADSRAEPRGVQRLALHPATG